MEDFKKIFDEAPDRRLWDRLDERLEKKSNLKKLKFYRLATLAAMVTALVAAVSYFNHILDDHNPHLFASNEGFSSFVVEELTNEEEGLFDMSYFAEIRSAYSNDARKEEVELAGDYFAKDGEIGLSIELQNYSYVLSFSYDGFPDLELESINGQTMYFESKKGDQLKMNIEPYGLRLLECDFLPEYDNYQFKKLSSI